jgi:hypothetical protein
LLLLLLLLLFPSVVVDLFHDAQVLGVAAPDQQAGTLGSAQRSSFFQEEIPSVQLLSRSNCGGGALPVYAPALSSR